MRFDLKFAGWYCVTTTWCAVKGGSGMEPLQACHCVVGIAPAVQAPWHSSSSGGGSHSQKAAQARCAPLLHWRSQIARQKTRVRRPPGRAPSARTRSSSCCSSALIAARSSSRMPAEEGRRELRLLWLKCWMAGRAHVRMHACMCVRMPALSGCASKHEAHLAAARRRRRPPAAAGRACPRGGCAAQCH